MSDEDELTWAEEDALAERDAANVELHRMHTEWLAARAERDAAQTALGLASEEVRELRAEVERMKKRGDDFFAIAVEVTRSRTELEERCERYEKALADVLDNIAYVEGEEPFTSACAALSPASTGCDCKGEFHVCRPPFDAPASTESERCVFVQDFTYFTWCETHQQLAEDCEPETEGQALPPRGEWR